jgi:Caspase domain
VTSTDTLVAFAAKAGMTAADGVGDHSPFTAALLDTLATPGLDVRIAFGRVRDEVMKSTDNKQEPYVYGSIGGSTVALVSKPPEKQAPAAAAPAPSAADTLARDYEFAERIGTRQAWDSFLAAHSTGFFADLARAARDKIIAAEQRVTMGKEKAAEEETKRKAAEAAQVRAAEEARLKAEEAARRFAEEEAKLKAKLEAVAKSQQAPMVVASAPSAPDATRAVAPHMDEADIARLLQFHLKRVGCDPGAADGKWTDQSTRAMAEFNKRAKANFEVKVASLGALDAVKQQKERLCPLVCSKGFKVEEDRCVAEACKRGFVRSKSSGECERETKAAASPASRDEGGGGSGGGQIFCSERGGCNAVPKNCRIVHGSGTGGSGSASTSGQRLVCN